VKFVWGPDGEAMWPRFRNDRATAWHRALLDKTPGIIRAQSGGSPRQGEVQFDRQCP